jgi:deoxyribose-phosphate aldolase
MTGSSHSPSNPLPSPPSSAALHPTELARKIDHTLLKADTTRKDIEKLCQEARNAGFATVCVNSCWVPLASHLLNGSQTGVCTVVGFPLGASTSETKAYEASQAVRNGATEVDMVIPIGSAKGGDWSAVEADIRTVVQAVPQTPVKVILETALLTDVEKTEACLAAVRAGAAFVKTSTGFAAGGATVADITLMRKAVGPNLGVKASGGIRTREDAMKMIEAGATRLGTSAGLALIAGQSSTTSPSSY